MPKYLIEREVPGTGNLNEEMLREHTRRGEFPISRIYEGKGMMDSTTEE